MAISMQQREELHRRIGQIAKELEENIHAIVKEFTHRTYIAYFSRSADKAEIEANNYHLSVSSYVEKKTLVKKSIFTLSAKISPPRYNQLTNSVPPLMRLLRN